MKFEAVGMRKSLPEGSLVISTIGGNDTAERGSPTVWTWSNPTNRALTHRYKDVEAVSVEALWQGTKIFELGGKPDPTTLAGDWRRGKRRKPLGAWWGEGLPLITNVGAARIGIYIPAYRRLVEHWLSDNVVAGWVESARNHPGIVYLRDHDTGRGVFRNGPMSHAWLLSCFLNTGSWPTV